MGKNEDEPFDVLHPKPHPFIEAVIEILGDRWEKQIKEMKERGMFPDHGIVFKNPPQKREPSIR